MRSPLTRTQLSRSHAVLPNSIPPVSKKCSRCKEIRPLEDFVLDPRYRLGRSSRCALCGPAHCREVRRRARLRGRANDNTSDGIKACTICLKNLKFSEFGSSISAAIGLTGECQECRRHETRRRQFGITKEQYFSLLEHQGGVCAICRKEETNKRNGRTVAFSVDHCHTTGKIRGLLCLGCNSKMISIDDLKWRESAINYTQSHPSEVLGDPIYCYVEPRNQAKRLHRNRPRVERFVKPDPLGIS